VGDGSPMQFGRNYLGPGLKYNPSEKSVAVPTYVRCEDQIHSDFAGASGQN
jgi:hypothetical protein